jgi:mannan endo-1,4-beta-mannosidase
MRGSWRASVAASLWALASTSCIAPAPRTAQSAQEPPGFVLEGRPFCFAGANNYYAMYGSRRMVDGLFDAAQALQLKVVRIWGMLERGSLDGSVPNADGAGAKDGVYFQYWDPEARRPAYNDGPDGLERLDYVVEAAAKRDLKLIIVLLNNWRAFGGIDQYLIWYGRSRHHEFFTAPETRRAYRAYLEHLINRRNRLTQRYYREDPTIFGWELANEPRCKNGQSFDAEQGWDTSTLTTWAAEMSSYVKSLDANHLVSVGDEGFLNRAGAHFTYRAEGGVDHAALTALPSVDFGTFHVYPDDWQTAPDFGERWIAEHVRLARRLGKPTLLEEYGVKLTQGLEQRRSVYQRWQAALLGAGGSASLAWMLAATDARGDRYPDYDRYTFYRDDATGALIGSLARKLLQSCSTRATGQAPSPYVSVSRPPERVALGWLDDSATEQELALP